MWKDKIQSVLIILLASLKCIRNNDIKKEQRNEKIRQLQTHRKKLYNKEHSFVVHYLAQ